MHPHYNSNYSGDIALFYLSGAAVLNYMRFLMKVQLPSVGLEHCQWAMDRLLGDSSICAMPARGTAASHHNTSFLLGTVSWGEGLC